MTNTAPYTQPVRYTKDDIEIVKEDRIGSPAEPSCIKLFIHIKNTDYHILLRFENKGVGKWFYDIDRAQLTTPEWKKLRGEQRALPQPVRDLFYSVWGAQALVKNVPQKKLG